MKKEYGKYSIPYGNYFADRSGYEGTTFQREGNCYECISQKSNAYKWDGVKTYPVVINRYFDGFEEEDGVYTSFYECRSVRSAKAILKWYAMNDLNVIAADLSDYDATLTIKTTDKK